MFVARAAQAIEAGQCHDRRDLVRLQPALGARRARSAGSTRRTRPRRSSRQPYGPLYPAVLLRDGRPAVPPPLRRARATQLAEVAVAAREWALLNPAAFRHEAGPAHRRRRARAPTVSTPLDRRPTAAWSPTAGERSCSPRSSGRATWPKPPVRGARLRREHHQHLDDRRRRPDRDRRRRVGRGRLRPGRARRPPTSTSRSSTTPSRSPCCSPWRRSASAAAARRATSSQDGRIRPGGALPAQHLRRRAVLLPPRPVRRAAAGRGGPPAARRVRRPPGRRAPRSRSRTAPAASCPPTPPSCWGWTDEPDVPGRPTRCTARRWWDATREHRLLVQACRTCGHVQHPPRALCTGCGSTDAPRRTVEAGGAGDRRRLHRRRRARRGPDSRAAVRRGPGPAAPRASSCSANVDDRRPARRARSATRSPSPGATLADGRALPVFHPHRPRRPDELRARRGPARVQGAAAHLRRQGDRPGRPRVGAGRPLPDRDRRRA